MFAVRSVVVFQLLLQ